LAIAVGMSVLPALMPMDAATSAPLPRGRIAFPTNKLTVKDPAQLTGRRMNLPLRHCKVLKTNCQEIRLINQLDGFDLDPRIALALSAPVKGDITKQFGKDVLFVKKRGGGKRIGLNRFVYDARSTTLYGHPIKQLREKTTYRIVYRAGSRVSKSTFTTMTTSRVLEQMRRQLDSGAAYGAADIAPADRLLDFTSADDTRTVFQAPNVQEIDRYKQTKTEGDLENEMVLNTAAAGAGLYAFGSFRSPSWLDRFQTIPQQPTKTGKPKVRGAEDVGFTLIVPEGTPPEGGWPVAIFGPGITRSKYDLFLAADGNAGRGIATFSLDPVGHAFGPKSETGVTLNAPPSEVRFSAFGRGRDLDDDGIITDQEGVSAPVQPHRKAPIALRDGLLQTAADVMALTRAIGRGVDVDGDGNEDLQRKGISFYAQSLGGIYGTMVMGADPRIKVGVLNVPGGPIVDIARQSPVFRPLVGDALRNRIPCLLNGGKARFTESLPLFMDKPVTDPAKGALAIQEALARTNWIDRSGSPEAFSPLLRQHPLRGVPKKEVIYQFAYGDQTVPNPTSATLIRAGKLMKRTSFYRNDRTATSDTNPHGFLLDPRLQGRNQGQLEVLEFIDSQGATILDPDAAGNTWEVPIAEPNSLEVLNFEGDYGPDKPAHCGA
jgi:hypothetical protein